MVELKITHSMDRGCIFSFPVTVFAATVFPCRPEMSKRNKISFFLSVKIGNSISLVNAFNFIIHISLEKRHEAAASVTS